MSQQIKNKSWLGAIALAIKSLMGAVVDLMNLFTKGIAMADKAVEVMQEKQAADLTVDLAHYSKNALLRAAAEQAKIQEELNVYISQDATGTRKKNIEENHNYLKNLVDAEINRIRAKRTEE